MSQAAGTKKVAPCWGHSFKEAKKEGCQGKSKAVPFRQPERRVERCRDFWKRVKLITVAAASLVNSESALAEPKLVVTRPRDMADSEAVVSDAVTSTNLGKRTGESQAAMRRGNCRILHIRCTPILSTPRKKPPRKRRLFKKLL